MFRDFSLAVKQLGDPRFRKVLLLGVGLTLGLLFGLTLVFMYGVAWLVPESVTLPLVGQITWVGDVLSWAMIPLMMGLSVFLMVPVAAAFMGLFLEEVAEAVEERHYPHLPAVDRIPLAETIRDALGFLGVLVLANGVALVLYLLFAPLAPVIFWLLNGFLLGREYFQLVAMRRVGRQQAAVLRREFAPQIWLSGALMAVPLSIPVVNLLIPVLGAATFTHLFHRLTGAQAKA
ncbi:CysZ-like protein [Pseudoruegeria aquimaris]|uniref:CysZ-like protein n=2 Tax=Pseudoruegeria aquimaris TaxID=393663 RepID=A0A1Y5SLN7_9RHOB|nr:EI24 domain-containing protein [Pseudoruegeria aquimaris]SLN43297.1 CysZ-like protein [Pseudoruegeria aquimaris]